MPQHEDLSGGRWLTMSLAQQMGNIGSEVHRARLWRQRGNEEHADRAIDRMLELLDLTLSDPRWRGSKRREVARVREALCDSFFGTGTDPSFAFWDQYFTHFTIAARP